MDIASRLDQPLQSFEAHRDVALVHGQEGPVLLEPYIGDLLIDRSGIFFLALRKRPALESAAAVIGHIPGVNLVAVPLLLLSASANRPRKAVEMLRSRAMGDLLGRQGSLRMEWGEVRAVKSMLGALEFDTYRGTFRFRGSGMPAQDDLLKSYGELMPWCGIRRKPSRWERILHKKIL